MPTSSKGCRALCPAAEQHVCGCVSVEQHVCVWCAYLQSRQIGVCALQGNTSNSALPHKKHAGWCQASAAAAAAGAVLHPAPTRDSPLVARCHRERGRVQRTPARDSVLWTVRTQLRGPAARPRGPSRTAPSGLQGRGKNAPQQLPVAQGEDPRAPRYCTLHARMMTRPEGDPRGGVACFKVGRALARSRSTRQANHHHRGAPLDQKRFAPAVLHMD